MPETLWCNKVKEFGPLIVSIDAQGRNLFEENKVVSSMREKRLLSRLFIRRLSLLNNIDIGKIFRDI